MRYIWEIFTGIRDDFKLLRLAVLFMLISGGCASLLFYYKIQKFREINFKAEKLNKLNKNTSRNALKSNEKNLIDRAEEIQKFRMESLILAATIKNMGANLFAAEYEPEKIAIAAPPEMSVKAKILSDKNENKNKNSMIILNIAGNNGGLTLKTGDSFMNGRGRILNIDKEYVLINFDGKEIKIK